MRSVFPLTLPTPFRNNSRRMIRLPYSCIRANADGDKHGFPGFSAALFDLCYFIVLKTEEAAQMLGVSESSSNN